MDNPGPSTINPTNAEKDGTSGGRGTTYEIRSCMLFAVLGYIRNNKKFYLRYQVNKKKKEDEKFDDILIFDGETFQFVQLKHKENDGKQNGEKKNKEIKTKKENNKEKNENDEKKQKEMKLTSAQLFNEKLNSDYNLLKYVIAFLKDIEPFYNCETICNVVTNIDFDINEQNEVNLSRVQNKKWINEISKIKLEPVEESSVWLNFSNIKCYRFEDKNIINILKLQTDTEIVSLKEKKNRQEQTLIKKQIENLEKLSESNIENALRHIIYVVGAPNDVEVQDILKCKLTSHFQLHNADALFNLLENRFTNWCNKKDKIHEKQDDPQIIGFTDIETILQKNVKNISFGVIPPTSLFTGREEQLEAMRDKLSENSNIVISQTLAVSGLGGIGKTTLTRAFIQKYKGDFFGRVIWIQAESNQTVEESFKKLAEEIEINKKSIEVIIKEVFEYFQGFKVLFVFDNYDKYPGTDLKQISDKSEKDLVIYCCELASASTDRPYFIFTSRNRECLPKVKSIDLSNLTDKEAFELIIKGLKDESVNKEDVKTLAEKLQNFPLALQQAIAYINEQQEILQETGGNYEIKQYLDTFDQKSAELLDYAYTDDFGKYEKTTFITWGVTLDAIKNNKEIGEKAIEVLQYMSYLYADKIDPKLFLPLFDNDQIKVGRITLLLSKYSMITKTEGTFYQIHRLVQTVIRLKFQENEKQILDNVWKLIDPKMYKHLKKHAIFWFFGDTFLHYLSILSFAEKYPDFHEKIVKCVEYLYDDDPHIRRAFENNDEETLKQIPGINKKKFANRNVENYIRERKNTTAKRLIEYLDNNERDFYLIESLKLNNTEIFKYLVENGANLNESDLDLESPQLVQKLWNLTLN